MSTISCAGRRAPREEVGRGDQDARRAEAALQRVMTAERLLQRPPRQALDRAHVAAVGLHGEHQARAHGDAVELDGARAADAVLAADVRARQAELVSQEVAQQRGAARSRRARSTPLTRSLISRRLLERLGQRALDDRPVSERRYAADACWFPKRVDERGRPRTRLARRLGGRRSAPPRSRSSSGRAVDDRADADARLARSCRRTISSEHAHAASAKSPWRSANSAKPTAPPSRPRRSRRAARRARAASCSARRRTPRPRARGPADVRTVAAEHDAGRAAAPRSRRRARSSRRPCRGCASRSGRRSGSAQVDERVCRESRAGARSRRPCSPSRRSRPSTRFMSTSTDGRDQPEVEQRHERLAAGEHLRLVAVLARAARRPPRRCSGRS